MISAKAFLRAKMRELRHDLSNRSDMDILIAESFLRSDLYRSAKQILLYARTGAEADTRAIFEKSLHDGKEVFFPYCVPDTNQLRFFRVDTLDDLAPGAYNIPAPSVSLSKEWNSGNSAVCVVPGLAFTESGKRLGYGKGYYDTFLNKVNIIAVGLCYSVQILPEIPTEVHDYLMKYLCTEKGLIPCGFFEHGGKDGHYER